MKICFLTYSIFDIGGIQRVVSVIANKLSLDNKIDIVCMTDKFPVDRSLYNLSENINVRIKDDFIVKSFLKRMLYKLLRKLNLKTGIFNNEKFLHVLTEIYFPHEKRQKLINYLEQENYDVVVGVAGEYSLLLSIIAKDINSKTIGWQHNSYDAYLKTKEKYFWNEDQLFNKFIPELDKYLVLSDYDKIKFLSENNVESEVIFNPVSFKTNKISNLKQKKFLAAGRLTYQKGFDLLIEAFYEFSKSNHDWTLVIVGEGEEKGRLNKLIKKYNLEKRIKIKPFTDDIKKYFLESSILLLSSRWEGMPMIVLESLVMGVPIIAFDITSVQSSIINNYNGILVEKYDVKEFSKAMIDLCNNEEEIICMGKNSLKKSKEFDIDFIYKQWVRILSKLTK